MDGEADDGTVGLDPAMLSALGLDSLVPASLARWRPLVLQGVVFFLERLPAQRLEGILAEQLELPDEAGPAQRVVALLAHCPTLHKLGQVVARDRRLDPELRLRLQTLESLPPTTPMAPVLARIRAELADDAPLEIADQALAEASVAVVVPCTWWEQGRRRQGVCKVLKPGVEQALAEELAIWSELGRFLEARGRTLGLPPLDYKETLDSVRDLLAQEVRLDREQAHLAAAAAFYGDDPGVLIPRPLPWSTPRMTVMERVFGMKITEADLSPSRRHQLADTLIAALLARPFWSPDDPAVIHADPHAGNLMVTPDGRLAVLDWSLTARLSKAQREAVVSLVLGALTLDGRRIRGAIAALGSLKADDPVLVAAVDRALGKVRRGRFPGFDWVVELLDDLGSRTVTGFYEDLVLFRKTWLTLSGVLRDLAGEVSGDRVLLALGLQRFVAELPLRAVAPSEARGFSTHVSNRDLMELWSQAGLVTSRYWMGRWRDALGLLEDASRS